MDITNCKDCGRPYERTRNTVICQVCADQEKEDYEHAYEMVRRFFRQLNFNRLSKVLGVDSEVLTGGIHYRLGRCGILDLAGFKKGSCYWCSDRLNHTESKEPFCLPCARKISKGVKSLYRDQDALAESSSSAGATSCEVCEDSISDQSAVCPSCYADLQVEVAFYRQMIQDHPELAPAPGMVHGDYASRCPEEVAELLQILTLEEETTSLTELHEMLMGLQYEPHVDPSQPMRHYGFKRARLN